MEDGKERLPLGTKYEPRTRLVTGRCQARKQTRRYSVPSLTSLRVCFFMWTPTPSYSGSWAHLSCRARGICDLVRRGRVAITRNQREA
ncbi:hypothetical protein E2C01_035385 [Portunus trituberculatus]|uniref:Uncharacterized protein n=1 Tax=Portunus trituberculatus TaxID=210409 RepID=A0A5B7F324_PORTR|nr:hypothetical protein [Portunus trituberculatus]